MWKSPMDRPFLPRQRGRSLASGDCFTWKNYVVDEFEHRFLLNNPEHTTAQWNEEGLNMIERFLSK